MSDIKGEQVAMVTDGTGIVVIGRNEGERLRRCLTSLNPKARMIVYVDSASTDGSVPLATSLGAFVVNLDLSQRFTAARARNEGFKALLTLIPGVRFVQFVDGDCEVESSWIHVSTAFLEAREEIALVCGRRRERFPESSIYNWLCDLEWNTPCGETLSCGGDFLIRAEAFEQVGGFRPEIMAGEEPEMCVRLRSARWKIWRLDVEMTRHDAAIVRFGQWWKRTVRSGYGYAEVSTIHRHSPFQSETRRAFFWAGVVPITVLLSTLVWPYGLFSTLIYPFQIARVVVRRGPTSMRSWIYAFFGLLGKFAELNGILKFYLHRMFRRRPAAIEYKIL